MNFNLDPNPDRCDLCDIKFTSPDHANSHFSGRKHKKKVCDVYAHQTTTNSYQQQNFCQYCKIQVSGPAPMRQHRESAKHIKKVQEAMQRSRNGSGDSESSRSSPTVSPPGSTTGSMYNDFDLKPDSTTTFDGDKPYMEDNYNIQPGPSGLLSNPPLKEHARCYQEDEFQPGTTNTVVHPPNGTMQNHPKMSPTELALKLGGLELGSLREQLVTSCTKMIKEQLETMIPTIVEKIVDKTIESLQDVGRQQQQEALGDGMMMMNSAHSPGNVSNGSPGSFGAYQTSASSVCSQLFPTGNFETPPVSMSGQTHMNGHHSFAGSSFDSYHRQSGAYPNHSARVTMPPPGFHNAPRMNNPSDESKY